MREEREAYFLGQVAKKARKVAEIGHNVHIEWHIDGLRMLVIESSNDAFNDCHRL